MNVRRYGLLAAASAAAVCLSALTFPAGQASPTASDELPAAVEESDQLRPEVASALAEVLAVTAVEPGLGGELFDRDSGRYVAYLVGEPSAKLVEVAASVRGALDVEVSDAVATEGELDALTQEILQVEGVAGVLREPDGSRLTVDYRGAELPVGTAKQLSRSVVGVRVEWNLVDEEPVVLNTSRANDTSPFNGGSRVNVSSGGGCSMGLPVRRANGSLGLLTAAHCAGWGQVGREFRTQTGNRLVGRSQDLTVKRLDAQFVRAVETAYQSRIVVGNYNSGSKRVIGPDYRRHIAGDRLRISGGYSGVQVGDIVGTYTPGYGPAGVTMSSFFVVDSIDNTAIAGDGDSGSPVFELWSDAAVPAGIHSGSFGAPYARTCEGVAYSGRACSSRALVAPWCDIKSALNLEPYVEPGSWFVPVVPGRKC